jgi:hypothetical protein
VAARVLSPFARLSAGALFLLLFSACAGPRERYAWGSYEELIYLAWARPGEFNPQAQVDKLQEEFGLARAAGKPLPPGWHAHLGALYYQLGQADQAHEQLLMEKASFPESVVLVDTLLRNLEPVPAATEGMQ